MSGKCFPNRKTTAKDESLLIRESKMNPRITAVVLTREMIQDESDLNVTTLRR